MRNKKAHEVALSGLLFALAIVLSMAESAITPLLGLAPGVKIGLANIVVMYAVFFSGAESAVYPAYPRAGGGASVTVRGASVAGGDVGAVPSAPSAHLVHRVGVRGSGAQSGPIGGGQCGAFQPIGFGVCAGAAGFGAGHGRRNGGQPERPAPGPGENGLSGKISGETAKKAKCLRAKAARRQNRKMFGESL